MVYRELDDHHVFIDESALDNSMIILGAIIVRDTEIDKIRNSIIEVQERIKLAFQVHNYPIIAPAALDYKEGSRLRGERARLLHGGLPEIHAKEIWDGSLVYFKNRSEDAYLFDRHIGWIEDILRIIKQNQIILFHKKILDVDSFLSRVKVEETNWFDRLEKRLPRGITRARAEKERLDPYNRLLSEMILSLDLAAIANNWTLSITCDVGKRNEIFRNFISFEIMRKNSFLNRLSAPKFKVSHEEVMIQLADVATFVYFKYLTTPSGHRYRSIIDRLYSEYILPQQYNVAPHAIDNMIADRRYYAIHICFLIEMLYLHSGGSDETLQLRTNLAQQHIQNIIAGWRDHEIRRERKSK